MDFGMNGFESMEGFDALDAIAGAAQTILPLAVGTGVSFGVSEAILFLVDNTTVRKWRWAIGFAGSLLLGLAMWKFRTPEDGALTIGSGLLTSAVGWGNEQLLLYKAKKTLASGVALPGLRGTRGLGRFVTAPIANDDAMLMEMAQSGGEMDASEYAIGNGNGNGNGNGYPYLDPGIFG